jgi:long-subunit fatty acid transport protein
VLAVLVAVFGSSVGQIQADTLFQKTGISSSPNPVGSGARAMGMGGAFIGIADDATAASWNPAGLIQLETPEVSIVGDYGYTRASYSSAAHPEIANTSSDDNVDLNYFSAAIPFHLFRNMVFSVNYQRLYDFNQSLDYSYNYAAAGIDLMQDKRYRQEGSIGALGLAGAIQITPTFSLGMTLNVWTDRLFWENEWRANYTEHGVGTSGGLPTTIDTNIEDKYSQFRGLNANFGVLWNMTPQLTIGAVVKAPFTATAVHEYNYQQVQNGVAGAPISLREDVELDMPLSYGLGVAWRFSDALSVDFDIYRTDWSNYALRDQKGNEFSPIDGRPLNLSDVENTIQARLGGEYLIIMQDRDMVVPLRAGLFYDPEPSEGDVRDFYGFALGSGVAYKQFIFDVAYQVRWGSGVDTGNIIATSEADVTQQQLLASVIIHF